MGFDRSVHSTQCHFIHLCDEQAFLRLKGYIYVYQTRKSFLHSPSQSIRVVLQMWCFCLLVTVPFCFLSDQVPLCNKEKRINLFLHMAVFVNNLKMSNICWFQLITCNNLLLFTVTKKKEHLRLREIVMINRSSIFFFFHIA